MRKILLKVAVASSIFAPPDYSVPDVFEKLKSSKFDICVTTYKRFLSAQLVKEDLIINIRGLYYTDYAHDFSEHKITEKRDWDYLISYLTAEHVEELEIEIERLSGGQHNIEFIPEQKMDRDCLIRTIMHLCE